MKSIVLIGMMGCGKSTCASLLAKALQRAVVDTDAMIVAQTGRSVAEIFESLGQAAFRDLETQLCRELSAQKELVIATGGGLVLRAENVRLLQENGVFVFLNRPADQIYDATSLAGRPLAQDGREAFLSRFRAREPIYRRCAAIEIHEFQTPQATVAEILRQLSKREDVL